MCYDKAGNKVDVIGYEEKIARLEEAAKYARNLLWRAWVVSDPSGKNGTLPTPPVPTIAEIAVGLGKLNWALSDDKMKDMSSMPEGNWVYEAKPSKRFLHPVFEPEKEE